jgi:hypothetical protein
MHVHSLITLWASEPLVRFFHFKNIVLPILKPIMDMKREMRALMLSILIVSPKFYERVVGILQTNLTTICEKRADCVLFSDANGLSALVSVLSVLASANWNLDVPLPFTRWANDSFTAQFSNEIEAFRLILRFDLTSGIVPDFFHNYPFLFTVSFKQEVAAFLMDQLPCKLQIMVNRGNLVQGRRASSCISSPPKCSTRTTDSSAL